jgi:hypothetical protein
MRTIFYATSVTLFIAAAACSDNKTTGDAGPPPQLCPTTIVQATSAPTGAEGGEGTSNACHVDQFVCVVGFQCGAFTQQATCTCNGTKFACVLADHSTVPDGVTDPTTLCLPDKGDAGSPGSCPTDKTTADGTPCTTAGQQCAYATTCVNPPRTDVCQCQPKAQGDAGLAWQCDINSCP